MSQHETDYDRFDYFPFDLFQPDELERNGGEEGQIIAGLRTLSMYPPYPWGQWLYGRLLRERLPDLEGDMVECGVGQGGMSIYLGRYAQMHGRTLYSLDSFEGLPPPDPLNDNPYFVERDYAGTEFSTDLCERVRQNVADGGVADSVQVIKGFFKDTLPTLPDGPLAFVHIDVDLYSSAHEALEVLFPRLPEGGILALDDFFHHAQGPSRAASRYFASIGYEPLYHVAYPYSVVINKGEACSPEHHRCIDGNRYSLDYMRGDPLFERAVARSVAKALSAKREAQCQNARRLLNLLRNGHGDSSADIYEYWYALNEYWDKIDRIPDATRRPITL